MPRPGQSRSDLEIEQAMDEARASRAALPPTPADLDSPDWVILGVEHGAGVRVYASKSLSAALMRARISTVEPDPREPFASSLPRVTAYELSTVMGDIVAADGRNYAEAIAVLFDLWAPDGEQRMIGP